MGGVIMSDDATKQPLTLKRVEPEYIYVTIPAEYICVYHKILIMLADYGVEMLKDCKAHCTKRNSNVIECFNMFNSAVAARKLGQDKLAETLIKYIKAKINQIYKGNDPKSSFVFPIDETGELKAFVSCGERPKFEINLKDGKLYEHKFNNGFDEHFRMGNEDESPDTPNVGFVVNFVPIYERRGSDMVPDIDLYATYDDVPLTHENAVIDYYFDDVQVSNFNEVLNPFKGVHKFTVVVKYKGHTKVINKSYKLD